VASLLVRRHGELDRPRRSAEIHRLRLGQVQRLAAQTIYRDGKFYFYATTAQGIGVAVSSSPTGPFRDAIGKALITNSGCGDIDPTVFIDDDG
jgi:hypothetical protein